MQLVFKTTPKYPKMNLKQPKQYTDPPIYLFVRTYYKISCFERFGALEVPFLGC